MKVSIIIPAYNEQAFIAAIIGKVKAVVLPDNLSKEIIVVNDGSVDQTPQILHMFAQDTMIKIFHQSNQGKAAALMTGLKNATGDIFLIQDADLEYDPGQYPCLLAPILAGKTDVVYGSRFLGNIRDMKFINRLANQMSNWTLRLLWGAHITDVNTCYKVFTRRSFEGITITSQHFAFETEITVKFLQKGMVIQEVPIDYTARTTKAGKKITWPTALEMYWPLIKYRFCRRK